MNTVRVRAWACMRVRTSTRAHVCTGPRGCIASAQRAWAHTRRTNRPLHTDTLRTKSSLVIFRFCTERIHDPFAVGPCIWRIIISIKLLLLQGDPSVHDSASFLLVSFRYRPLDREKKEGMFGTGEATPQAHTPSIKATRILSPPEKRRSLQKTHSIRHALRHPSSPSPPAPPVPRPLNPPVPRPLHHS